VPALPDSARVARLFPNLAAQYRDAVTRLQAALQGPQDSAPAEALQIVRAMVEKVVVTPGATRYRPCALELHGSLAALLAALAPGSGEDATGTPGMMQLVAGARYRLHHPPLVLAA
jgi:hypothetical protein